MVPSTRLEPEVRREEILSVARRAFARDGYAAVSMASIGKEAGVTPGLVNHYYGTKRDLYVTVLRELAERLPQLVRTDLAELPLEDMVQRNVAAFLDSVEHDAESWQLLLGAGGPRDAEINELVTGLRSELIERMAQNHARGSEPTDELRLALRLFQGAAEAGAREWLRNGPTQRQQVQTILCRILLGINRDFAAAKGGAPT